MAKPPSKNILLRFLTCAGFCGEPGGDALRISFSLREMSSER